MIFDYPNNYTYFREVIPNESRTKSEEYSGKEIIFSIRYKNDICISICPRIGVELGALLQYNATGPINCEVRLFQTWDTPAPACGCRRSRGVVVVVIAAALSLSS
jgi:hypothetical protein